MKKTREESLEYGLLKRNFLSIPPRLPRVSKGASSPSGRVAKRHFGSCLCEDCRLDRDWACQISAMMNWHSMAGHLQSSPEP